MCFPYWQMTPVATVTNLKPPVEFPGMMLSWCFREKTLINGRQSATTIGSVDSRYLMFEIK